MLYLLENICIPIFFVDHGMYKYSVVIQNDIMQNITITYIGNHWCIKMMLDDLIFLSFCLFYLSPFFIFLSLLTTFSFIFTASNITFLSIKIVHCSLFQYYKIKRGNKRVEVDWIQNVENNMMKISLLMILLLCMEVNNLHCIQH